MESNLKKFNKELSALIKEGELLGLSLALDLDLVSGDFAEELKKDKLPNFKKRYEAWYSLAMQVVKQLLPDRLDDFIKYYKNDKRKNIDASTYGVSDYMIGINVSFGIKTIVDQKAAYPKFEQQLNILKSANGRLESSLFDMVEIIQADFFDDELEAAINLCAKGFLRAAGAIAGVVLEKHLGNVCKKHNLKASKKNPTINDFNQILKDGGVIDTPIWRQIQFFGDIRNLCDHNKEREPRRDEIEDLIAGVSKVIKSIF